MQIDWWTLGLQAVNALVLIWLLARFLYRPVVDAIAARQQAAGKLLADAQAAKAAAESEREQAAAQADAGQTPRRRESRDRSRTADRGASRRGSSGTARRRHRRQAVPLDPRR